MYNYMNVIIDVSKLLSYLSLHNPIDLLLGFCNNSILHAYMFLSYLGYNYDGS